MFIFLLEFFSGFYMDFPNVLISPQWRKHTELYILSWFKCMKCRMQKWKEKKSNKKVWMKYENHIHESLVPRKSSVTTVKIHDWAITCSTCLMMVIAIRLCIAKQHNHKKECHVISLLSNNNSGFSGCCC